MTSCNVEISCNKLKKIKPYGKNWPRKQCMKPIFAGVFSQKKVK